MVHTSTFRLGLFACLTACSGAEVHPIPDASIDVSEVRLDSGRDAGEDAREDAGEDVVVLPDAGASTQIVVRPDGSYEDPSHATLPELVCARAEDGRDWTLFNLDDAHLESEYGRSPREAPFIYPAPFESERFTAEPHLPFMPAPVASGANARPMLRDQELNLQVLTNAGNWVKFDLKPIVRAWVRRERPEQELSDDFENDRFFGTGYNMDEQVAIDRDCNLYTIVQGNRSPDIGDILVLVSTNGGVSWHVHPLGVGGTYIWARLEHRTGARVLDRPPAVLLHSYPTCLYTDMPCRVPPVRPVDPCSADASSADVPPMVNPASNLLALIPFERRGDAIAPVFDADGHPFIVSTHSILGNMHAGSPRAAVSVPGQSVIHIVYPTTRVDPIIAGNGCAYSSTRFELATFDLTTRTFLVQDQSIGQATLLQSPVKPYPPTPIYPGFDDHDQPALAISSDGYLHLVTTGHNSDLTYARSTEPFPTVLEFEPEILAHASTGLGRGLYTYPSLVTDERGNAHIVARSLDSPDRTVEPPDRHALLAVHRLAYLRFRNDLPVRGFSIFSEPRRPSERLPHSVLVDPGRSRYGMYYHKLQTDRLGRLWVISRYLPSQLTHAEANVYEMLHGVELTDPVGCFEDLPFGPDPTGAPGLIRCGFSGIEIDGPFLYMSRDAGGHFRLAETRDFAP